MRVREYGVLFETGTPVTFKYVRNTEKSPYLGGKYQQDIEPAGIYLLHNPEPGDLAPGWVAGEATIENPLVLPLNSAPGRGIYDDNSWIYDDNSWKAWLHRRYKKRARGLTRALLADGHDGVVTVTLDKDGTPVDTREIVLLPQN